MPDPDKPELEKENLKRRQSRRDACVKFLLLMILINISCQKMPKNYLSDTKKTFPEYRVAYFHSFMLSCYF